MCRKELQEACGAQSDKGSGSGFPVAIWPKVTASLLIMIDGSMDDLPFYFLFNSISVISGQWADDDERLCAMEPHLGLRRFPLKRGLNPEPLDQ